MKQYDCVVLLPAHAIVHFVSYDLTTRQLVAINAFDMAIGCHLKNCSRFAGL